MTTDLQPQLQRWLDDHVGTRQPILGFTQRPCQYTSTFRIDELDVTVADGTHVRLVLKNLSLDQMVDVARRGRPEFLYDPQREIRVYQWVLPDAPPGPPVLYGSSAEDHWLLLEQVDGAPVWQVGDVGVWEQAADWIARFHRAFSPEQSRALATRVGAIVCDRNWYWQWLHRAQGFAAGDPARQRVLEDIARGFDRVVDHLTSLPQTLIHGEFYPSNILIRARADVRVCPVDWEMTALGPALIDLAALTAGWAESTQRVLARAYVGARGHLSKEFLKDLDCCRLYLAVRMLGWSGQWTPPQDHAHNWMADAERTWQRLEQAS